MSVKKTVFLAEEKKLIVKKYRHYRHTDKWCKALLRLAKSVTDILPTILPTFPLGGLGGIPPNI